MTFIPFNSRSTYFKSKFGSITTEDEVTFRIAVPCSFNIGGAFLMVKKDGGEYTEYKMNYEMQTGEDSESYTATVKIGECGLYFYHFDFLGAFGRSSIMHSGDGLGAFPDSAKYLTDWQLTVSKPFDTPDWLKGGIIYQIFPDRFMNSGKEKKNIPEDRIIRSDWGGEPYFRPDRNGEVLNNDYFGGDLEGIRQKLPYLKDLGVTCIYLNPIFEAHSNHRYNTADYSKIDPILGDEKDFINLCKSADKLGIKIILDGVFSHTGDDSVYFNRKGRYNEVGAYQSENSKYAKWYKFQQFPDKYDSWWGFKTLPEVKEEDESYREFICGENGIAAKWLKLGAAGFRLDVADELPDIFLDNLKIAVKKAKPDALLLGEVWEDATNKFSYGVRRRYLLGDQLDSVMNYPFAESILDFCRTGNAEHFMSGIMNIVENYPKQCLDVMMNHIGTHDTVRAITRLAGESSDYRDREWQSSHKLNLFEYNQGIELLKLAAALQYTLPGVPSVYYGDEAGLQGYRDPFNRGCYPWGNENCELIDFYKKLGKIRAENSVFKEGKLIPVSAALGCVAYIREDENGSVMIIANRNIHGITYYLPESFVNSKALYGEKTESNSVDIPACSFVILANTY